MKRNSVQQEDVGQEDARDGRASVRPSRKRIRQENNGDGTSHTARFHQPSLLLTSPSGKRKAIEELESDAEGSNGSGTPPIAAVTLPTQVEGHPLHGPQQGAEQSISSTLDDVSVTEPGSPADLSASSSLPISPVGGEGATEALLNFLCASTRKGLDGKKYILRTAVERATTENQIAKILNEDHSLDTLTAEQKDEFAKCILQQRARILFAISVYSTLNGRCLQILLNRGLTDRDLPLGPDCACPDMAFEFRFQQFMTNQFVFLAPSFRKPQVHRQFKDDYCIPVQYKASDIIGSGAGGRVFRVEIDSDQHELVETKTTVFAMKVFHNRPTSTHTFSREFKILADIRKFNHRHILKLLTSWEYKGTYYMLFPCADCNLEIWMKKAGSCTLDGPFVLWFFTQLTGLVDAIRGVHNIGSNPFLEPQATSQSQRQTGFHHDIKPENILYFAEENIFRLADFGSGKVELVRSGPDGPVTYCTRSQHGTLTYEAPEARFGQTSRPYDMWSIGCVFLELLIRIFYGYDTLHVFREKRLMPKAVDETEDDRFWYLDERNDPHLRPIVRATINQLGALAACKDEFCELLKIISSLLNTNHRQRPEAFLAHNQLHSLIFPVSQKIEENLNFYLLPESTRPLLDLVIDDDPSKYTEYYTVSPVSTSLSPHPIGRSDGFSPIPTHSRTPSLQAPSVSSGMLSPTSYASHSRTSSMHGQNSTPSSVHEDRIA